MSNVYPINKESFLNISGVGPVKYQKYGERFTCLIKDYIAKNNIITQDEITNQTPINQIKSNEKFEVTTNEKLYNKLRELREEFSKIEGKMAYLLITQNSLKEISGRLPVSLEELEDISGFGTVKIKKYGEPIIKLAILLITQ